MKKKNTFAKFKDYELKEKNNIKGGLRAAPNTPGGSGGSSWIDWGDIDARNFGQIRFIKDGKLGVASLG